MPSITVSVMVEMARLDALHTRWLRAYLSAALRAAQVYRHQRRRPRASRPRDLHILRLNSDWMVGVPTDIATGAMKGSRSRAPSRFSSLAFSAF